MLVSLSRLKNEFEAREVSVACLAFFKYSFEISFHSRLFCYSKNLLSQQAKRASFFAKTYANVSQFFRDSFGHKVYNSKGFSSGTCIFASYFTIRKHCFKKRSRLISARNQYIVFNKVQRVQNLCSCHFVYLTIFAKINAYWLRSMTCWIKSLMFRYTNMLYNVTPIPTHLLHK